MELIEFAGAKNIDIAFLDINLRGITGLEVAEKLVKIQSQINIIFVTGFDEYKSEAMDLHASGYLMKPVTAADVENEIRFLRYPVSEEKKIKVKCFGNFAVFFNGSPADFEYNKTKELLAYLVDRKGAMVTGNELSAVLWEDDTHTSYLKKLYSDLKHTFERNGCADAVFSGRGSLGIDISKISCDYIDYINNLSDSEGMFRGEYMSQYSWAEKTLANLLKK